jgi:hypothetical protein
VKPWNVDIELTEGCSRLCSFCGIHAIRNAPGGYRFMDMATALSVSRSLARLNPKVRVEFAGHGEPLMNPRSLTLINVFRDAMPKAQLMVTTNGATLRYGMEARLDKLFSAGLNLVVLDTYEPERRELIEAARALRSVRVLDYYSECIPSGWSPWANHGNKVKRTLVLLDDLALRDGESSTRKIDNRGGSRPGGEVTAPLAKTCTLPFRTLVVTWDGKAILCCVDWERSCEVGDVARDGATAVWYGKKLEAARAVLSTRDRRFAPCHRCDRGAGARVGLLPRCAPPTREQLHLLAHQG